MITRQTILTCLRGDRKAQYELYSYCYALLMPVGMRYYKDHEDASSAVNMTVVRVLDKYKLWKEGIPFDAWVKRMYINHALDQWRRQKKSVEVHQEWSNRYQPSSSAEQIEELWKEREILEKIEALPALQSTIFKLFSIEGYNHKEIGSMIGLKEGHSRYLLHQARKNLQEELTQNVKLRS